MNKHSLTHAHIHTIQAFARASISKKRAITFSFSPIARIELVCENHRSAYVYACTSFLFASAIFLHPHTEIADRAFKYDHHLLRQRETRKVSCELVLLPKPNHILSRSTALVNCGSHFGKNSTVIPWSSIAVCVSVSCVR